MFSRQFLPISPESLKLLVEFFFDSEQVQTPRPHIKAFIYTGLSVKSHIDSAVKSKVGLAKNFRCVDKLYCFEKHLLCRKDIFYSKFVCT